jgi:hypothetical protein
MSISNPEIKKLYGLSAGRCNICQVNVFENEVNIGEMAHTIAKKFKGPRGSEALTIGINSYENLILLCANHHSEVDQNPEKYTINTLHKIKSDFELFVKNQLNVNVKNKNTENTLKNLFYYMSFTKFLINTDTLPEFTVVEIFRISDAINEFSISNPHIYPFDDVELQNLLENFLKYYFEIIEFINNFYIHDYSSVAHFIHIEGTNNLKFNRHNLPYDYVSKKLPKFNKSICNAKAAYINLVAFVKVNYRGAFQ